MLTLHGQSVEIMENTAHLLEVHSLGGAKEIRDAESREIPTAFPSVQTEKGHGQQRGNLLLRELHSRVGSLMQQTDMTRRKELETHRNTHKKS